jgi:hypothetical protein
MEDHEEMTEDSISNVTILKSDGTFIVGTQDGTVTGLSHSMKCHRVPVNVSEDLLYRQI